MVYLFLANGFEEVEALTPLDLLRRAGVDVTTVAVGGGDTVVGSHDIPVVADLPEAMFRDSRPDAVILPGGMPGTTNLAASRTVASALRAAANGGGVLAAICAAPSVLGQQGYLKGRTAVCYPGFEDRLTGATVGKQKVVRDGRILTAVGMGVAMDFGLELIRMLVDDATAARVKSSVLAD